MFISAKVVQKLDFQQSQLQKVGIAPSQFSLFITFTANIWEIVKSFVKIWNMTFFKNISKFFGIIWVECLSGVKCVLYLTNR